MILVLGATGQIGGGLVRKLGRGRCQGLTRQQADLSRPETLSSALDALKPELVINAAAYTDVERAEGEEALARVINVRAPGVVAAWCAARGVPLIHFSTDFVFSGEGTAPWKETDPTRPLNAYARTKLEGEQAVLSAGGKAYVLRTAWIYSVSGRNFLRTMLELGRTLQVVQVVDDQVGSPTYAEDLAAAVVSMLGTTCAPAGIYHLCSTGDVSRHGFAQAIFEEYRATGGVLRVERVEPVPSRDYPSRVVRPLNSRLSMDKWRQAFGFEMPHWRDALKRCIRELNEGPSH